MTTSSQTASASSPSSPDLTWNLLWDIRLAHTYHLKRERFLDGVDRLTKGIGVFGGATAFAAITSDPTVARWAAVAVTLISTVALVYGPSERARRHSEFARDYKRLEGSVLACEPCDAQTVRRFEAELAALSSAEFASLGALVTHCHNQLCAAYDKPDDLADLPWWQNLFMNWFDWDQSGVKTRQPPK